MFAIKFHSDNGNQIEAKLACFYCACKIQEIKQKKVFEPAAATNGSGREKHGWGLLNLLILKIGLNFSLLCLMRDT